MKILVVEDDSSLADVLRRGLAEAGHVVDVEADGPDAEHAAAGGGYDAIVLDVNLPRKSGLDVARALRAAGDRTPILMLTARDTVEDTVTGLNAGADDYLRKPFVFDELEARLRSITRREPARVRDELRVDDLVMDLATRTVTRSGRVLALSARETAFLEYFMRNAGLMVTREMLEDALWERERETESNVIAVYVRRLRVKLSPCGEPQLLHTVRGAGYRFGVSPGSV
ncbi:MAG: two component transcriptional regulator, winged helix family [Candidatus Eremiobacteraeota bacterium]|nr:two component transcriptional regulator, winged helix family [Candidatus Eremiobacteraeota bacterium]